MPRFTRLLIIAWRRIPTNSSENTGCSGCLAVTVLCLIGFFIAVNYIPFGTPSASDEFRELRPKFESIRAQLLQIVEELPQTGSVHGITPSSNLHPAFYMVADEMFDTDRRVQRSLGLAPSLTNADCVRIEALMDPRRVNTYYARDQGYGWNSELESAFLKLTWTEEEIDDFDPFDPEKTIQTMQDCARKTRYVVMIRQVAGDEITERSIEGFIVDLERNIIDGTFAIDGMDYLKRQIELQRQFTARASDYGELKTVEVRASSYALEERLVECLREVTGGTLDW